MRPRTETVTIGEITRALTAGVSVNSDTGEPPGEGKAAVLKTSCIARGRFYPSESKGISGLERARARLNPRRDTIIVSRMNTPHLVGECGYVDRDWPNLFLPDRLWLLELRAEFRDATYLVSQELSSERVRQQLKSAATGTSGSMKNLSREAFLQVELRVPDKRTRDIAGRVVSDAARSWEALDQLIAKKEAVKEGVMHQLMDRGSQQGTKRKLGDLFRVLRNASNSRGDCGDTGDAAYLHYGDIHSSTSDLLDVGRKWLPRIAAGLVRGASLLRDGDLVLADASEDLEGIGKAVEIAGLGDSKLVAGLHTIALRPTESVARGFSRLIPSMPQVRTALLKLAAGVSVFGISKRHVREIELRLPSLDEQRAIAEVLTDMDAELEALKARRDKTQALKQGMMQELLSGRIRLV